MSAQVKGGMSGIPAPAFDAFISYSRKDADFALGLQRALERYAPPFEPSWRRRRLKVFLDQSDLEGVEYFEAIGRYLAAAQRLIVICSPDAAQSRYVDDEIERFVALRGASAVVPVLWRGLPSNEAGQHAGERAFPPAMLRALRMPLAVDYRRFDPTREKPDSASHRSAWIGLIATLLGRPRAEVERREAVRRRRRLQVWAGGAGAVVAVLAALAVWALLEGERALAGRLAAQAALPGGLDPTEVERRALLAREAVQRLARLGEPTLPAETPLRGALAQIPRRLLSLPPGDRSFAFAADGASLVVAEGGRLQLRAIDGGAVLRDVAHTLPVSSLAPSSDLRHVAGIDVRGMAQLWTWPALDAVTDLPREVAAAPVTCIGFEPGGATVVALRLRDEPVHAAEFLRWRPGESKLVEQSRIEVPAGTAQSETMEPCLGFGKGGTAAVIARLVQAPAKDGARGDLLALRWPLRSLDWPGATAPIRRHEGLRLATLDHNGQLIVVDADGSREDAAPRRAVVPQNFEPEALSDDGAWLLVSRIMHDPYVPLLRSTLFQLLGTATGEVRQVLADQSGGAVFLPDSARVATISSRRVRVWDRRSGAELLRLKTAGDVKSLRFDAASRHAAAVRADGAVEIFAIGDPETGGSRAGNHVLASLGGPHRMASAVGTRLIADTPAGGGLPATLDVGREIDGLVASADGKWLVLKVVRQRPLIRIVEPTDGEAWLVETAPVLRIRHRIGPSREARFDARARRLAVLSAAGVLRVIDLERPEVVTWQTETGRADAPRLALSGDGEAIAVADKGGLALYRAADGARLREDREPTGAVALSTDGQLIARGPLDGPVRVERSVDGAQARAMESGGVTGVRDLVFSPQASRLLGTGGTTFGTFLGTRHFVEEHLEVWDVATGRALERIPDRPSGSRDYKDAIGARADEHMQLSTLVWNPDTRELAAVLHASMLAYWTLPADRIESRIHVWRLEDSGLVEVFRAANPHKLTPTAVASGTMLTLISEDGFRFVQDASGRRLPALACRWIARGFSAAERAAHLGSGLRRPSACPAP